VFSIEPEGISNGCTTKVMINSATTNVGIQTRKKLSDNGLELRAEALDVVLADGSEGMSTQFSRPGLAPGTAVTPWGEG